MTQAGDGRGPIDGHLTRLRPVSERDLDLLAGWFGDAAFVEHWGGVALTRDEVAAKYVGRRRPDVESFIVLADDRPIGYMQYWHAQTNEGGIDLLLTPAARGHGYGTDAATALTTYLLQDRGWTRVTVDPAANNLRAVRAWAKAGFRLLHQKDDRLLMEHRR